MNALPGGKDYARMCALNPTYAGLKKLIATYGEYKRSNLTRTYALPLLQEPAISSN